jgi:hypothetical protein
MDYDEKYALQRQEMLRRQALELRLMPVESSRRDDKRQVSWQTLQSALAQANADLLK